ncbi:MAG TPA: hypothetical protein VM510_05190, partial [Caulifigura sp.]|nr:hypothetical protein [Caulifigura sp.]
CGRVYWSKYFCAGDELPYDVNDFDKWYRSVVRWIRKNGRRTSTQSLSPYYLPDAWEQFAPRT